MDRIVVTELHYHRNGCAGEGYYAGRAEWHTDDETFRVMFTAFNACEECAIMADGNVSVSFRHEDFAPRLRRFIQSRGGQALAFPHTIAG